MAQIPENLKYTASHEWVTSDDPATVGITATATEALGDVVFLELPAVGATVTAGGVCGEIESTKSVSELYSPVTGTVVEVNQAAVKDPSVVNADPFGAGWLIRIRVEALGELLSPQEYATVAAH
jgi:glycine cleavage system H protein